MAKAVICVLLASLLAFCRSAPVAFHGGSDAHCPLTVKILDAVKGTPAGNIALDLFRQDQGGTWEKISSGPDRLSSVQPVWTSKDSPLKSASFGECSLSNETQKVDMTGEVHNLITEQEFTPGVYRVEFDTLTYWKAEGRTPFHQLADVVFEAHAEGHRHYTLALLLSPFSYTTTAVVVKAHD